MAWKWGISVIAESRAVSFRFPPYQIELWTGYYPDYPLFGRVGGDGCGTVTLRLGKRVYALSYWTRIRSL